MRIENVNLNLIFICNFACHPFFYFQYLDSGFRLLADTPHNEVKPNGMRRGRLFSKININKNMI